MAITLGALTLPDGLVWSDEDGWSPIAQSTEYGLTGALIVDLGEKQAGRPITLRGAKDGSSHTALIARSQPYRGWSSLDTLRAALWVATAEFTLTLHDGRTFTVLPLHGTEGPLSVTPLSAIKSLPPAKPGAGHLYFVDALRLITK